jgi:glutamate decarboxylase
VNDLQTRTGLDIPIHVDGASGGFIAPFAYPSLKWGFDVPRVVSINTSGHKFGLVYPGLGWIVWKDQAYLHKDLVFELRMSFHMQTQNLILNKNRLPGKH